MGIFLSGCITWQIAGGVQVVVMVVSTIRA
jgi:hypothetical protein